MIAHCIESLRRKPLASGVAAILGATASAAHAATVSNCFDSGAGSLRDAVSIAASGDTIDLTGLTTASPGCANATISLSTGAIGISQDSLTISGPGMHALSITGKYNSIKQNDRIFTHTGNGTLTVQDLTVKEGYLTTTGNVNLLGGCIYSKANVSLTNVSVYLCGAYDNAVSDYPPNNTLGGGVYTLGSLTVIGSAIGFNTVQSKNRFAQGGGLVSQGFLTVVDSAIVQNYALGTPTHLTGTGAGAVSFSGALIEGSTISRNYGWAGSGAALLISYSQGSITINNSTISGNRSGNVAGAASGKYATLGLRTHAATVHLSNTTIAFNNTYGAAASASAGLFISFPPYSPSPNANLQSVLIANNTAAAAGQYDFQTRPGMTITGANNLIRAPGPMASVPNGTLVNVCPLLHPLADNGGTTRTHRQERRSPGTDVGNNAQGFPHDQRGAPFLRVSGVGADIGAYEIDQGDIIFDNQFEGCP